MILNYSAITRDNRLNPANRLATSVYFKWWDECYGFYGGDWNLLECQ